MLRALAGQAQGWASNLANRGRRLARSIADPVLRHEVMWINAYQLWKASNSAQNAALRAGKGPASISQLATRMARRWFESYVKRFSLPDPTGLPLQFNQLSAKFEKAHGTTHGHFGYWATLSTLGRGKRIRVPVEPHAYFAAAPGEIAKTLALRSKDGALYLDLVRAVPTGQWERPGVPVIALDLGLRNFLASSEGDLRGENFIDSLRRYDRQLQLMTKGLQGAGIVRLSGCARYRRLVVRIRLHIKNNVQRWVRSLLEAHCPEEVVLEKLNFVAEDSGLGRRMNRLLRGFGQLVFRQCVKSWSELKGFKVTEVEAAYTSQMCSSCGFVHRANRKGNSFGCLSCGHLAHADVNAAKNQRGRSAQGAFTATGGRHEWWAQALREWLLRLRAGLLKALPGSTLQSRLVWRARTGIAVLLKEKRSTDKSGTARKLIQEFLPTLNGVVEASLYNTITELISTELDSSV
jgi:putative transposase